MRTPTDLHPDDRRDREHLAHTLDQLRIRHRISRAHIARELHVTAPAVTAFARRHSWSARTVMRHARALGYRLQWHLNGLSIPDDDGDILAVIYTVIPTTSSDQQDHQHWLAVCNDLRRVRRATCTTSDMAARLGVTDNAVRHWETNPDGSSVNSAQRHARALGGTLGWSIQHAGTPRIPLARRAAA
jgi:DNA-binding XRE family transcriptional regulator